MIPGSDVTAGCSLLFVYGTLRRGFELHHHLTRLGARFRTKAKAAAVLIDRGRYPGALPSGRRGHWVRGEVFQLRQPVSDLRVLDKIEGFIRGAPQRSMFVRAAGEVILNNGAPQRAWIYWVGARKFTGVSHG
jgi:gamma-glutamylcyclotransferase (GGCT)/AIG2-like uncharacterized protein YtfP